MTTLNELPIYEMIFEEGVTKGIYGISLVKKPAIGYSAVQLSEEVKLEFKTLDADQQILVAPVLLPNYKIHRKDGDFEYFVYATADTIKQAQINFFKKGYQAESQLEHKTKIVDVCIYESWTIEDPNNDKANALGYKDLPKGTLMMSMKIDNKEVWDDYIKTGKVNGFSMDSYFKLELKNIKKTNMNFSNQTLVDILTEALDKIKQTEQPTPLEPVTSATTETIQTEVEAAAEVPTEIEVPTAEVEIEVPTVDVEQLQKDLADKTAELEDAKKRLAELEGKLSESEGKLVQMSATPAKAVIKDVDLSETEKAPTSAFGRILAGVNIAKNK